jgi:hypothetical protein
MLGTPCPREGGRRKSHDAGDPRDRCTHAPGRPRPRVGPNVRDHHLSNGRAGPRPTGLDPSVPTSAGDEHQRPRGSTSEVQPARTPDAHVGSARSLADGCDLAGRTLPPRVHSRRQPAVRIDRGSERPLQVDLLSSGRDRVAVRFPPDGARGDPCAGRSTAGFGPGLARDRSDRRAPRVFPGVRPGGRCRMVLLARRPVAELPPRFRGRWVDVGRGHISLAIGDLPAKSCIISRGGPLPVRRARAFATAPPRWCRCRSSPRRNRTAG